MKQEEKQKKIFDKNDITQLFHTITHEMALNSPKKQKLFSFNFFFNLKNNYFHKNTK